ncbi:hypothetical protein KQI52_10115 [bacterium]|nr:hypothetical protein [bacterium]
MKYGNLALIALALVLAAAPVMAVETSGESSEISPVFMRGDMPALDEGVNLDEWNEASRFGTSYSQFDLNRRLAVGLQADPEDGDVETVTANEEDDDAMAMENRKNPGRALLLSAIMPGAGELYAGKTWRAAGFFALEMAAWVGAIYYAQQGEDKETEYEKYADQHYHENYYRSVEYAAALDATIGDAWDEEDGQGAWEALDWQDKLGYLPDNFTHDLPQERNQQYYENIGKYMTQFGYGWEDYIGIDADGNLIRNTDEINGQAAGWGYIWAGSSPLANEYIDMRDESNQLLDRSATFFAVIMVNHVASALHAGFTVRAMNEDAKVEPAMGMIRHNDERVTTAGLRIRF